MRRGRHLLFAQLRIHSAFLRVSETLLTAGKRLLITAPEKLTIKAVAKAKAIFNWFWARMIATGKGK